MSVAAWIGVICLVAAGVLFAWMLVRRKKNVPVGAHTMPKGMPRVAPLRAAESAKTPERPRHYVDETAEFSAINPGRHATDTAWAMPAIKPSVNGHRRDA